MSAASYIRSFEPLEDENARVLILGSMPGAASLCAGEYYAHPRNNFWRMMAELIALDVHSPYEQRVQSLISARIALWDVLHSCSREGSLDVSIEKASQVPNDFESFFSQHVNITHVFFNGSAAEHIFKKKVLPLLSARRVEYLRLPSTSPANASIPYERKLNAWQAILQVDRR